MNSKIKILLPQLLLLLLLVGMYSCMPKAKPLQENQKMFVGTWTGEGNNQIVINEDGTGSYQYETKEGSATFSKSANPASIEISENKLLVTGPMGINFELKLDAKPQTDSSGTTFVIVDGVKLIK